MLTSWAGEKPYEIWLARHFSPAKQISFNMSECNVVIIRKDEAD